MNTPETLTGKLIRMNKREREMRGFRCGEEGRERSFF